MQPPWNWDGVTPLRTVVYFHSCSLGGLTAGFFNGIAGRFNSLIDPQTGQAYAEPVMLIVPEAAGVQGGGSGCWDIAPNGADSQYVADVIADAQSRWCLDDQLLTFAGLSGGGFAAQRFGCDLGASSLVGGAGGLDTSEAIAAAYGLTPAPLPTECVNPDMSVAVHHGRNDPVVPVQRALDAIATWSSLKSCTAVTPVPASQAFDTWCVGRPQPCLCQEYTCDDGRLMYCEDDGGHEWPQQTRDSTVHWSMESAPMPASSGSSGGSEDSGSDSGVGSSTSGNNDSSGDSGESTGSSTTLTCELVCEEICS